MKNTYKLLPILFVAFLVSCDSGGGNGGDDPQPGDELRLEQKLEGSWNLSSVKIDGSDVSSDFSGFIINFDSNFNYSITNGGTTFVQTSGTWGTASPTNNGATGFLDGITNEVTLEFSNDNKTMTLSFTVDDTTFGLGGRASGMAGRYVFVLNK